MEKAEVEIIQSGRSGKDIIIEVPLGTIAKDEETGKKEVEILEDGQEVVWIKGGRGGLGNARLQPLQTRRRNIHNRANRCRRHGKCLN